GLGRTGCVDCVQCTNIQAQRQSLWESQLAFILSDRRFDRTTGAGCMSIVTNLLPVILGAVALGVMMNTTPDYNSSFQPFAVVADDGEEGQGRLFTAELVGLKTAGTVSYTRFGEDVSRDTSATFLV